MSKNEKPERMLLKRRPVAALLEASGMNQSELGERMGLTQSRVNQMLRREKDGKPMQIPTLQRVALACGYDIKIIAKKAEKSGKKRKAA